MTNFALKYVLSTKGQFGWIGRLIGKRNNSVWFSTLIPKGKCSRKASFLPVTFKRSLRDTQGTFSVDKYSFLSQERVRWSPAPSALSPVDISCLLWNTGQYVQRAAVVGTQDTSKKDADIKKGNEERPDSRAHPDIIILENNKAKAVNPFVRVLLLETQARQFGPLHRNNVFSVT